MSPWSTACTMDFREETSLDTVTCAISSGVGVAILLKRQVCFEVLDTTNS